MFENFKNGVSAKVWNGFYGVVVRICLAAAKFGEVEKFTPETFFIFSSIFRRSKIFLSVFVWLWEF